MAQRRGDYLGRFGWQTCIKAGLFMSIFLLPVSANSEDPAFLVKDINATPDGSSPANLVNVNGALFFFAVDDSENVGLWKSDGSEAGTARVKQVPAGATGLINVNGTLFFAVEGDGLWKSDGTDAGTMRLTAEVSANCLSNANGRLFFVDAPANRSKSLWTSDGTVPGTALVRDLAETNVTSCLTTVNDTAYFSAYGGSLSEVWKSDGSAAGTLRVQEFNLDTRNQTGSLGQLTNVNGTLFFVTSQPASTGTLWKSDGSRAGTVPVATLAVAPYELTDVNGVLFFGADDGVGGSGLWKSDGTPGGTVLLKDASAAGWAPFEGPSMLAKAGGKLFFTVHGSITADLLELWTSDGTSVGTMRVKALAPLISLTFTEVDGTLFFAGDSASGQERRELWKSDGTLAGTVRVKTLTRSPHNVEPGPLAAVNGVLFFAAYDDIHGQELWTSDGTESGTALVKDMKRNSLAAAPSELTDVNGTLFFDAYSGSENHELWRSDGTAGGTLRVAEQGGKNLTNFNGTLVFVSEGRGELWKTDGTGSGTIMVKSAVTFAPFSSNPLTNLDGALFFAAYDGDHGFELWRSDGTEAGTRLLKDIYPGSSSCHVRGCSGEAANSSMPSDFINVNGTLFFRAYDESGGNGLWKSDGSEAGTVLVRPFGGSPTFPPSGPSNFQNVNGTLFFDADNGAGGADLWKSDGSETGTVLVKDAADWGGGGPFALTDLNGTLFFLARSFGSEFVDLWKSDGTTVGTMRLREFARGVAELFNIDGTLLFFAAEPTGLDVSSPVRLWRSDGTTGGTVPVTDAADGWLSAGPATSINRRLLFFADDPRSGPGLWRSDGTARATTRIQDLAAGGSSFTASGSHLFFAATDRPHGSELWAIPLSTVGLSCIGDCSGNGSVTVDELVQGVNIALGTSALATCSTIDVDRNGAVTVNEIMLAVSAAVNGCVGVPVRS